MSPKKLRLLVSLVFLAVLIGFFASKYPDGLEHTARTLGFEDKATSLWAGLLPGYSLAGWDNPLATLASGVLGCSLIYLLFSSLSRYAVRRALLKTTAGKAGDRDGCQKGC